MPLPGKTAIAGELSLAGEVRPLRRFGSRIKTAENLGFDSFLGPSHENYRGIADIKGICQIFGPGHERGSA
jgi:DNA repair protein RadA/Sms